MDEDWSRRANSAVRCDLEDYTGASNLEFNNKIKELIKNGRKVHHFGFGQSPFPIPHCFVEGLKRNAHRHEYLPVQGISELRQKIIDFHREHDNFQHFSADQMVLGVGSKEILFLTLSVFGGDVLLICPSWTTYLPQTHLAGRKTVLIPTTAEEKFVPSADVIEKTVREQCPGDGFKLLLLNSPNNPTGICIPSDKLQQIAEVCKRMNIIVMSDEIYARLQFDGKYESIANYYPQGTIVTSGFSKWASAGGWRTGYGLFPPSLSRLYQAVASGGSHTFTCAPAPMQYALNEGLDHKDELRDYMLHTRKILHRAGVFSHRELTRFGAKGAPSESAYYFMPDFESLRSGLRDRGVESGIGMCERMLEEANVALMPCHPYFLRPANELTTRFCFVNFDGTEALKESMSMGADGELPEDFLLQHCMPLFEGVNALTDWMKIYSPSSIQAVND